MINTLIQEILTTLNKTYGKDKKKYLPPTCGEYWESETEWLTSKGKLEAQELLATQPSRTLDSEEIYIANDMEYKSFDEFWEQHKSFLNDKYLSRLNQILYWTIHQDDESHEYKLHLLMLLPRKGSISNILISITPKDTPKIKRLLRKTALFNLYNFSQAFK